MERREEKYSYLKTKTEAHADELVSNGVIGSGARPLAYVSVDRLCLLLNEEPCRCVMARSVCSGLCTHQRQHCAKNCGCNIQCSHHRVTQGSELTTRTSKERCAAKTLVAAYHACNEPVVVAPVVGDAQKWTHDEIMKGEKLCFDFQERILRDCVFSVKSRKSNKTLPFISPFVPVWQWFTLYVDIDLCQLFLQCAEL